MDAGPAASAGAGRETAVTVPQTGASVAGFVVEHADADHLRLRAVERASAPTAVERLRMGKRARGAALAALSLAVGAGAAFAHFDLLLAGGMVVAPLLVAPWLLDADNAARAGVLSIARRSIEAYRVRPADAAYRGAALRQPLLLVDDRDVGEVRNVVAVDAADGPGTHRLYNVEIITRDQSVIATRVDRRDEAEEVVRLLRGALGLPPGGVWYEAGREHADRVRVIRAAMWLTGAALVIAAVALARAWAAEPVARLFVGAATGAGAAVAVSFVARAGGRELRRAFERDVREAPDASGAVASVTLPAAPRDAAQTR